MKVRKNIFLAIVLVLVNVTTCLADDPSPPSGPAKEEDFPINDNLVLLMIAGLSLGTVFIYKNKIKKASM